MAVDSTLPHPVRLRTLAESLPVQTGRPALSPAERLVLQVQGIDAWVAARRERERVLCVPGLSRYQRMDVAYEVEALRRTHDAIKGCCARGLHAAIEPMRWAAPTAVIAHRQPWFSNKLALHLSQLGMTVLVRTDNGAEALGAVVAEQPDVVFVGDRLAMMAGDAVLAESRTYAPRTLLVAQASGQERDAALRVTADTVIRRDHPPRLVADLLVWLRQATAGAPGGA